MSLTLARPVAFNALCNLKFRNSFSSIITFIYTLCCLLLFSFILASTLAAQEKLSLEASIKTVELTDGVNPETNRFESKAGQFSINISITPVLTRTVLPINEEEPGKQFFWKLESKSFTVMYSAFDINLLSNAFEEMNSGVRNSLRQQRVEQISEREISFETYKAREFRSVLPNGVIQIQRNYLVNKIGYLVTAGFVDEKSEKEAVEVLDSFRVIGESK
jgi:hypothetical protein